MVMVEEPVMDEVVMMEEPVMDEVVMMEEPEEGDDEDVLNFIPETEVENFVANADDDTVIPLDVTDIDYFSAANPGCCLAHLIEVLIDDAM